MVEALNIREGFYVQPGTTLMSIAQLAGPSEFSNTHCQHQGMSSQDAALTANSNANKMSEVGDAAFDSANEQHALLQG